MRVFLIAALLFTTPVAAQDRAATLADIRQELTVLFVEVQKLKRELSTTGGANVNLSGTNALDRINSMESELARLTRATETVTNRVDSVVRDGTNRVGDLEFRLCELEANCDIGTLGETPTLGGGALPQTASTGGGAAVGTSVDGGASTGLDAGALGSDGVELAFAERQDFDRAKAAFDAGNFEEAATQFQSFTDTYQGGPLSGLAHLLRGEALQNLGRTSSAARAYLESYSGTPDGPTSPLALLKLGLSLDGLGQASEACITLGEVTTRFPNTEQSLDAQAARGSMGCS
ncbi:MAG: tol-pal system protein YbgF [Paracoccaceae bacterium]